MEIFLEKWRSGFDLDEFHALCLKIVSFGRQQKKNKYTLSESYSIVSQQHEIEKKKKKKEWKVTMKGIEHLKVVT